MTIHYDKLKCKTEKELLKLYEETDREYRSIAKKLKCEFVLTPDFEELVLEIKLIKDLK